MGAAPRRLARLSTNRIRCSGVEYVALGSATLAISRFDVSTMLSIWSSLIVVRTSNPQPVSRTMVSASSQAISALVQRRVRAPVVPLRASLFINAAVPARDRCTAGATPARTAVAALTMVRNASTRASKSQRNQYGQFATGMDTIQSRTPAHVSPRPTHPATVESSVLSTTSCRRMRHRVAPSAVRIARSRPRPAARASSRHATLAQPTSRRKPAASSASLHGLSNPLKPPV
jgi:hypothetical protein